MLMPMVEIMISRGISLITRSLRILEMLRKSPSYNGNNPKYSILNNKKISYDSLTVDNQGKSITSTPLSVSLWILKSLKNLLKVSKTHAFQ